MLNSLWRPDSSVKVIKEQKAKYKPDPVICKGCSHIKRCPSLCKPLTWVNGNVPLSEAYLTPTIERVQSGRDYNAELAELIEDHNCRIEKLTEIKDIRKRAITLMLLADITQVQIARLLKMSIKQINRIVNNNKTVNNKK
jgi:hypothetical protein